MLELIVFGLIGFGVGFLIITGNAEDSRQNIQTIQDLRKKLEFETFRNKLLRDEDNSWKEKYKRLEEYHEKTEQKTRELEEKRSAILDEAESELRRRISQFEALEGQKNTEQQKRFEQLERGLQGFL